MVISTGDTLPSEILVRMGAEGPEQATIVELTEGRKVIIFGLPGAFTPTCSSAHVPSFVRTKDQFMAKGVDEIICVAVNDVFVMQEWGKATGAVEAGLSFWADPASAFTTAIGMNFDAAPVGLFGRSARYAMLVEDGVVSILHQEEARGVCELTSGESMLADMA